MSDIFCRNYLPTLNDWYTWQSTAKTLENGIFYGWSNTAKSRTIVFCVKVRGQSMGSRGSVDQPKFERTAESTNDHDLNLLVYYKAKKCLRNRKPGCWCYVWAWQKAKLSQGQINQRSYTSLTFRVLYYLPLKCNCFPICYHFQKYAVMILEVKLRLKLKLPQYLKNSITTYNWLEQTEPGSYN